MELYKLLNESLIIVNSIVQSLKDRDKIKKIDDKGFAAFKKVFLFTLKNLKTVNEIVWNLTEDEKYSKMNEGQRIVKERLDRKKKEIEKLK